MSSPASENTQQAQLDHPQTKVSLGGKAKDTSKIYSTHDYTVFKLLEQNRNLNERKVEQKMRELERHNLLEDFPVVVDKDFFVYDGQHRLEAAKRLGLPVHYKISTAIQEDDIAHINSIAAPWTLNDYLEYWIKKGHEDYIVLKDFAERHQILPYNAIGLLAGNSAQPGGEAVKNFERGGFHVEDLGRAEQLMEYINDFAEFFEGARSKAFMNAVARVSRLAAYNHQEMIARSKRQRDKFVRFNDVKGYLSLLEEVYNNRRSADHAVNFRKA